MASSDLTQRQAAVLVDKFPGLAASWHSTRETLELVCFFTEQFWATALCVKHHK